MTDTEAGGDRASRRQTGPVSCKSVTNVFPSAPRQGVGGGASALSSRHPGLFLQVPRYGDKRDSRGHDQGGKRHGVGGPRTVCAILLKCTNTCAEEPKLPGCRTRTDATRDSPGDPEDACVNVGRASPQGQPVDTEVRATDTLPQRGQLWGRRARPWASDTYLPEVWPHRGQSGRRGCLGGHAGCWGRDQRKSCLATEAQTPRPWAFFRAGRGCGSQGAPRAAESRADPGRCTHRQPAPSTARCPTLWTPPALGSACTTRPPPGHRDRGSLSLPPSSLASAPPPWSRPPAPPLHSGVSALGHPHASRLPRCSVPPHRPRARAGLASGPRATLPT